MFFSTYVGLQNAKSQARNQQNGHDLLPRVTRPLLKRKRGGGENVKRRNDPVMIRKKRGRDVVALLPHAVTVTTTRTSTTGVRDPAEPGVVAKAHLIVRLALLHQRKIVAVPQQLTMTILTPGLSGRLWDLPQSLQVLLVEKPH